MRSTILYNIAKQFNHAVTLLCNLIPFFFNLIKYYLFIRCIKTPKSAYVPYMGLHLLPNFVAWIREPRRKRESSVLKQQAAAALCRRSICANYFKTHRHKLFP